MNLRIRAALLMILLLAIGLGVSRGMTCGIGVVVAGDQSIPTSSTPAAKGAAQVKDHLVVVQLLGDVGKSSGLKVGDEITQADGQALAGMTVDEAIGWIDGFYDSTVELIVRRKGEPGTLTLTVTRHYPHPTGLVPVPAKP